MSSAVCDKADCRSAGAYPCPPCRCEVGSCADRRVRGDRCQHHAEEQEFREVLRAWDGLEDELRYLERLLLREAARMCLPVQRGLIALAKAREIANADAASRGAPGSFEPSFSTISLNCNPHSADAPASYHINGESREHDGVGGAEPLTEADTRDTYEELERAMKHRLGKPLRDAGFLEQVKAALIYVEVIDG